MDRRDSPRVVKFEPAHIRAIERRDGEDDTQILRGLSLMSRCTTLGFTAMVGDRVIGAAGLWLGIVFDDDENVVARPHCGHAWTLISSEIENYKLWFHRSVKQYFAAIERTFDLRCVQADALRDSERNCGWLERMGFEPQAPAHAFHDSQGREHRRYVLRLEK